MSSLLCNSVKLGDKEGLDKKQTGVKELFINYQPFHLLLDKERFLMLGNAKTYAKIVKTSKKGDFRKLLDSSWDFTVKRVYGIHILTFHENLVVPKIIVLIAKKKHFFLILHKVLFPIWDPVPNFIEYN